MMHVFGAHASIGHIRHKSLTALLYGTDDPVFKSDALALFWSTDI